MTTRRLLMAAAMAGLCVSIYSQASWYGLWLGSVLAGLALALAIDCGIFAAMRAAFDGDDRALWVVGGLALVSWLANAQHAAMIHAGGALDLAGWAALDPLTGGNAVLTAGIAPIAAVALAWLGHRAGKREAPTPKTSNNAAIIDLLTQWQTEDAALPDPPPPAVAPSKPAPKARKAAPKDWHPKASALLSEGYKGAEVARMIGVHPSQVSRFASANGIGANANGAGQGAS